MPRIHPHYLQCWFCGPLSGFALLRFEVLLGRMCRNGMYALESAAANLIIDKLCSKECSKRYQGRPRGLKVCVARVVDKW
jgi:hypothetical protein